MSLNPSTSTNVEQAPWESMGSSLAPVSTAATDGVDWRACAAIARAYGQTFYFASRFLPPYRRRAIHATYAWCRIADDLADRATDLAAAARALDGWERELDAPSHPVAFAFAVARERFGVPAAPARELLDGVRMDLDHRPFATWEDLSRYCYHVAGTVGLLVAPILGCEDPTAWPHAVSLGRAMQLTNILRDIGEDARGGRVYLPLADLAAFGCDPEAILAGRPNGHFQDLLAFEIARARALYADARRGMPALAPAGRMTALAGSTLYATILTRIEEMDYDVFATRAHVPTGRKLGALPGVAAAYVRCSWPLTAVARV
ncbi:MAG: crtB [Thermomicrobiales bacterium]|nr:crtB [Thermomicrobiales bacterium]